MVNVDFALGHHAVGATRNERRNYGAQESCMKNNATSDSHFQLKYIDKVYKLLLVIKQFWAVSLGG